VTVAGPGPPAGRGPFGSRAFRLALAGCVVAIAAGAMLLLAGGAVAASGTALLVLGVDALACVGAQTAAEWLVSRRRASPFGALTLG
jgi:hypothetical protein